MDVFVEAERQQSPEWLRAVYIEKWSRNPGREFQRAFNEDGNVDIAYPLSSDAGQRGEFSTALLIYLGDGTGNFTQGQTVTVEEEPGSTWAADFNKDGMVNGVDLTTWKSAFGVSNLGDADGDGDSDGADFLVWQRQYTGPNATAAAAAVPEPVSAAMAVAGIGGINMAIRRRRSI